MKKIIQSLLAAFSVAACLFTSVIPVKADDLLFEVNGFAPVYHPSGGNTTATVVARSRKEITFEWYIQYDGITYSVDTIPYDVVDEFCEYIEVSREDPGMGGGYCAESSITLCGLYAYHGVLAFCEAKSGGEVIKSDYFSLRASDKSASYDPTEEHLWLTSAVPTSDGYELKIYPRSSALKASDYTYTFYGTAAHDRPNFGVSTNNTYQTHYGNRVDYISVDVYDSTGYTFVAHYQWELDNSVEGTWKKDNVGWWYQYKNGGYAQFCILKDGGKYYMFNNSGYMLTGWHKFYPDGLVGIDGSYGDWYYMDSDGAMYTGWHSIDGDWYYFYSDGRMAQNAWVDNYYLTESGAMATGWKKVAGYWYYFNPSSGAAAQGWKKLSGTWYYFGEQYQMIADYWRNDGSDWYYLTKDGSMATGWQNIDGAWFYFNASGVQQSGWLKDGGTWYYLDPIQMDGLMVTGFKDIKGVTYYFNNSGAMQTGWQSIGGYYYYFYSDGAMARDTWIGSYHVNKNGIWDATK